MSVTGGSGPTASETLHVVSRESINLWVSQASHAQMQPSDRRATVPATGYVKTVNDRQSNCLSMRDSVK